jgi:cytochrome c
MKLHLIMGLLSGVALAGASVNVLADASAAEELAKKDGCLLCHAVDKKVVGPAYKDVAAKYKGDKSMEAKLIEKVKKGGSGVWGQIPMPPNSPQVKDEDIKTIVQWVLSLIGFPCGSPKKTGAKPAFLFPSRAIAAN